MQGLRFILSSAQPFPPSQPWNPPVPLGPRASGARHRSGAGARSSGCPLHPPRRSCHSAALPPTRGLAGRQHATEVPPSDPRLEPAKPKREKKTTKKRARRMLSGPRCRGLEQFGAILFLQPRCSSAYPALQAARLYGEPACCLSYPARRFILGFICIALFELNHYIVLQRARPS